MTRQKRTVYLYKVEAGIIAASGTWEVDFGANPGTFNRKEYAPFNSLVVTNNSTEDIEIRLERSSTKAIVLLDGQILIIEPEDGILFYDIDIVNRDAVNGISANEIIVVVSKVRYVEV